MFNTVHYTMSIIPNPSIAVKDCPFLFLHKTAAEEHINTINHNGMPMDWHVLEHDSMVAVRVSQEDQEDMKIEFPPYLPIRVFRGKKEGDTIVFYPPTGFVKVVITLKQGTSYDNPRYNTIEKMVRFLD